MSKVIAFDMDGVLADLHTEWLHRYNRDHEDTVTTNHVTSWDIHKFVKCGHDIYEYLKDRTLYDGVQPMPGAIEYVQSVVDKGHIPLVVTATYHNPNMIAAKIDWLKKHLPMVPPNHFVFMEDKRYIRADIMIDDSPKNLEFFQGVKLLMTAPHNHAEDRFIRVNSIQEVDQYLIGGQ